MAKRVSMKSSSPLRDREQRSCRRSHTDQKWAPSEANPFSSASIRNNFPGFDDAFKAHLSPIGKRSSRYVARTPPRELQAAKSGDTYDEESISREVSFAVTPDRDRSMCSSFTSPQNISADLSIGTRAALAEHRRQVSLFGFDGTGTPRSSPPRGNLSQVDEQWNQLLNSSCALTSVASRGGDEICDSIEGHEITETSAELHNTSSNASDFFNSSKVYDLMTPERNKDLVDRASHLARLGIGTVTERGTHNHSYESESATSGSKASGSAAECSEASSAGMAFLFSEAVRLNDPKEQETSLASFASEQVSVLSQETSSGSKLPWIESSFRGESSCGLKRSPNESLTSEQASALSQETSSGSKPPGVDSSSRGESSTELKTSPNVTFQEEDGGVELITEISDILPEFQLDSVHSTENNLQTEESSTPKNCPFKPSRLSYGKENESLSSLALSPIALQAGSTAERLVTRMQPVSQRITSGEQRKSGSGRLPLSPIVKLSKERLPQKRSARKLLPRRREIDPNSPSLHQGQNLSSEASNHSGNAIDGPSANTICGQTESHCPVPLACQSFGSHAGERQKPESCNVSKKPSGRKNAKLAISSLRERYSRPDRFEDGFACAALTNQDSTK